MAKTVLAVFSLLSITTAPAFADSDAIPDEVHIVADERGIDPVDLWGAMISTNIWNPRDYLCVVGEGPCNGQFTPVAKTDQTPVPKSGPRVWVRLTYYTMNTGVTANGGHVYNGSTACSYNFAFGTRFELPDGSVVTCNDRGQLGDTGWLDVFGRPDIGRLGAGYVTILN